MATVQLRYPDEWVETWAFPDGAEPESMIDAGLQLIRLAGVDLPTDEVALLKRLRADGQVKDQAPPAGDETPAASSSTSDGNSSAPARDRTPKTSAIAPKSATRTSRTRSTASRTNSSRLHPSDQVPKAAPKAKARK